MSIIFVTKCPYCGFKNKSATVIEFETQIVECFADEGGCGKEYIARTSINVKSTVFKIEGES